MEGGLPRRAACAGCCALSQPRPVCGLGGSRCRVRWTLTARSPLPLPRPLPAPFRVTDMARKLAALGLAALLGSASAGSVELNKDNFDAEVFDAGKSAFVKFQAPW